MSKLTVKVSSRKTTSGEVIEGTATIPGFKPTKIARNDGTTEFTSRSALNSAAQLRAKQLGMTLDSATILGTAQTTKKAAKKSLPKTKKSSSKTTVPSKTPSTKSVSFPY